MTDPFGTAAVCGPGAGRLGRLARPVPRGRQRRGGPRPRRLPRPAGRRAGPERRRRRRPAPACRAGCGSTLARRTTLLRRQHRRAAGRGRRRVAVHPARLRQAGRDRRASAGSASASPPCSRSPTSPRCSRPTGGVRFARPRHAWPAVAAAARPRRRAGPPRRPGAGAAAAVAGRGRRRRTGTTPGACCRCATAPRRRSSRRLLAGLPTRCCSRCPACDVDRRRRRRRCPHAAATGRAARCGSPTGTATIAWRAGRSAPARSPADLLADRPVEERDAPHWSVTWAVPGRPDGGPRPLPAARSCTRRRPPTSRSALPALLHRARSRSTPTAATSRPAR